MKKFYTIVAAAVLAMALACGADAQSRFGVIGGMTFSSAKQIESSTMTQWHAGFTAKLDLPLGLSLQPSLLYHAKGAKLPDGGTNGGTFHVNMDYLELPVSLQWGPDLLVFRPFLDITPFIGYALKNEMYDGGSSTTEKNNWTNINRFSYGVGVGAGLEIWRFQVIGRYTWNLGSLANAKDNFSNGFGNAIRNTFTDSNFSGFTLSVALLFGGGGK